jgi:hypothetical protein
MTFQELSRVILSRISFDEAFFKETQSWPLMVEQWPVSLEREALKAFISHVESNEIKFAQWKLMQYPEFEKWREYLKLDPNNSNTLKQEFKNLLHKARAESTAMQILKAPDRALELMRAYEMGLPVEDELQDVSTLAQGLFKSYKQKVTTKDISVSLPSWPILSEFIGGFNAGRLAICMAQTGFGKTNLALNLALCAQERMNTWFFNMEMNLEDIFERMLAIFYRQSFTDLRRFCDINLGPMLQILEVGKKFRITSGRDKSLKEIQNMARTQSQTEKPDIIFIDYDQKISLETSSQTPEWKALQIAMIALEDLAKELNCFVIVLAQANQEGEISGSNRSRFSASSVWSFEDDEDLGPVIKFNKNRFGERNKVLKVEYEKHCARIREIELVPYIQKKKRSI